MNKSLTVLFVLLCAVVVACDTAIPTPMAVSVAPATDVPTVAPTTRPTDEPTVAMVEDSAETTPSEEEPAATAVVPTG